jgi:hypothetical protein
MTEAAAEAERSIEWVPLDVLQPDPANPKGHDEDLIAGSMSKFGMVDLITRDDRTGYIISGHGRLKSLQNLHAAGAQPPASVRVADDGSWLTPVVTGWSSTDDLVARGALITLNRATELGGWVDEALLSLLDELREADALDSVGFGDVELEILRRKIEADGVFTHGADDMLDEFRDISGQDPSAYAPEYARKVTVFIRDAEAIEDFRQRLGVSGDLGADLNYPLGWVPNDRRKRPNPEAEPDSTPEVPA